MARQNSVEFRTCYRKFVENVIFRQNVGRNKHQICPTRLKACLRRVKTFKKTRLFQKIGRNSMFWSKIGRKSTYIVENRSNSLVTDQGSLGEIRKIIKTRIHTSMFFIIWHLGGARYAQNDARWLTQILGSRQARLR